MAFGKYPVCTHRTLSPASLVLAHYGEIERQKRTPKRIAQFLYHSESECCGVTSQTADVENQKELYIRSSKKDLRR